MTSFKSAPLTLAEKEASEREYQKHQDRAYMEAFHGPDLPLHQNLRRFRIRKGLKKQEIAEMMGVTARSYYAYEEGQRPVPSDALAKLATMTEADLNEIVMGRTARDDLQTIRAAIDDMMLIMKYLVTEYPAMDMKTRLEVARHAVSADTGDWPRTHPEMVQGSVKIITRYRFHPEELPPPPDPDRYEDNPELYERKQAEWQVMVDEDLGDRS